jgi:hypothetical protein
MYRYIDCHDKCMYVYVCVYMHTRFIRTDDEMCVCVCCTLDPTEMSPTTTALFAGRKERRKQVCFERG